LRRSAFTLIELMIVIVIMGVVYSMAVNSFTRLSDESANIDLKNLKEYMINTPYESSVKVICLDDCSECNLFVDGIKTQTLDSFVDDSVRIYRYEYIYGFTKREFDVFFNVDNVEENVCFSYKIDEEGIGDQVLIEFKDKFYDFSPYFTRTQVFSSLEDANSARAERAKEVIQ